MRLRCKALTSASARPRASSLRKALCKARYCPTCWAARSKRGKAAFNSGGRSTGASVVQPSLSVTFASSDADCDLQIVEDDSGQRGHHGATGASARQPRRRFAGIPRFGHGAPKG